MAPISRPPVTAAGVAVAVVTVAVAAVAAMAFPGVAGAQDPGRDPRHVPDNFPATVIPEELRLEADRLQAEDDAAALARDLDDELRAPDTPVPRFDTPARRLSDLHRDERSIERLRIDCRSAIHRRDITLFGNGTIRLRVGPTEQQEMFLEELGPEELTAYLKRLIRIRRSDRFPAVTTAPRYIKDSIQVDGEWIDFCRLTLELPGEDAVYYDLSPLETQPLEIGHLMRLADELAGFTRPLDAPDRLPSDYEVRRGDLLRKRDSGMIYRIISPTDDGEGVELEALSEPMVVYFRIADLPSLFSGLVEESEAGYQERPLRQPAVLDLEERAGGFSAWGRPVGFVSRDDEPERERGGGR